MGSIHAQFHKPRSKEPDEVRLPFILAQDPGFKIIPNLTAEEVAIGLYSVRIYHDIFSDELVIRKVQHDQDSWTKAK